MPTNNQIIPINNNNTIQATTNPQSNLNKLQTNTQQMQNPITIPIQIQPSVVNAESQNQYNVPEPIEYQRKQNTIPYQNTFNNYQTQYNYIPEYPQITIPTANINTIEGQYQSNYSNAINQIANSILNMRFSYNPNEDDLLKAASQYVTQNTFESMNSKGILNSSMTAERVAQVVGKLIPEYEKMAREEFDASFSRMMNVANLIMNMDEREFRYWQDARDQRWKEEEQEYQRKQDALKNAWQRVDELGYVDNNASIVLGVPVGTLSKDAREAKEEYERKIAEWNRQHEIETKTERELLQLKQSLEKELYNYKSNIEMQNEKALYNYKSNIDTQKQKELYEYKSNVDSKNDLISYENKLKMQQKYGVSTTASGSIKSSKVSLSTYEGVIQNRWGEKDIMTDQYTIKQGSNDEAYNFLLNEYVAGNISDSDVSILLAKYNITKPREKTQTISTTTTTYNGVPNIVRGGNGGGGGAMGGR